MKQMNSLKERVIAMFLAVTMIVGMLPFNIVAAEGSAVYGTVEGITAGAEVTDANGAAPVVKYETADLTWSPADPSIGRMSDGWWVGIKITAPADMTTQADFIVDSATYVKYQTGVGDGWSADKNFWNAQDSDKSAEDTPRYLTMWGKLDENILKTANMNGKSVTYKWQFDWDMDGSFEQLVTLSIDPSTIELVQDEVKVYPAASAGYGEVEMLTGGAQITGSGTANVTVEHNTETEIHWYPADPSIGRYQDGWWAGMKITAPAGISAEQLQSVHYMSGTNLREFWAAKDSADDATEHFMTMWIPLNGLMSGPIAPYTYKFDWNNDGVFEQTVTLSVDAEKVTLTKDGVQMYPVLGAVSAYTGGTVSGSETGEVTVTVEQTTLNWSPADLSIGRYMDAWWAGIRVEAPAGMTEEQLQNAKYQRKDADTWSADKSFWNNKDSQVGAATHFIGMWISLTPAILAEAEANNENITREYQFDWDNNGTYEQHIVFTIVPSDDIVLNKLVQSGFAFETEAPSNQWVGQPYQNIASGGQGDGAVTYEIIDEDINGSGIATIDASTGELTFLKIGTVTVQATKAADSNGVYAAAAAVYTVTAVKNDQTPRFTIANPGTVTYAPGKTFENQVEGVLGGSVSYEIINTEENGTGVATIDAATGKLTILKTGTVTVKATITGDGKYNPAEQTYTLVIQKADQPDFAFDNAPTELTWQLEPVGPLALVNGLGEGTVTWTITDGEDVASVSADGKITLLKAGTFTIQAQKAGDDCYNASAPVTATILVNKVDQTGFGFGETEEVTVTYNDNGNQHTLTATGGQSSQDTVYAVISGDAASVDNNGVVTIMKAGTVIIQATKPADNQYKAISDTYELTIKPDTQEFVFEHGDVINLFYGTSSYTNQVVFSGEYSQNSSLIYTLSDNEIGATIDAVTGNITFVDSQAKVGTLTITATKAADDCYDQSSHSYTITVSYENTPNTPYTLDGDKIISDSDWFTGDVAIKAPHSGYWISYSNALEGNTWDNFVIWDVDGCEGSWSEGSAPVVYLMNSKTGAITDAIPVPDLKRDTEKPTGFTISYEVSVWATIGEKLFGFHPSTVRVTIAAADSMSGIGKMEYSLDGGVNYTEIIADNGVYEFSVPSQYRGQLWMRATDAAGNAEVYKHLDNSTDKVLVVDHTAPGLLVGYTGGMDDTATSGVRYVKSDKVTVAFEITDENFDLRAADPIVTVNGEPKTGWVFDATTGKLTFDLTDEDDYVIKAEFTDRLSRKVEYESEVRVDRTEPGIKSTIVDGKYYTENQTFVLTITEHNFDAAKVNLVVNAVDSKNNPVLNADEIQKFADDAKILSNWNHTEGTDVYTLELPITKDGNYTVTANCDDILGWGADTYTRTFTVDKVNPNQPTLKYEVGTEKSDLLIETILNKLFGFAKETTVVTVQSGDATSGIDYLKYKLHDEDAFTSVYMNTDGKYTFNLDPQYRGKITVVVYDKAGRSAETVEQKEIVVDNITPKVEIAFTGDRQDAVKKDTASSITRETMTAFDETTRFIYNGNVTATIKVKEANFFPDNDDMTIRITHDGSIVTDLVAASITDSGWEFANDVYTRTFVMTADGDYQLFAEYKDHSLNDMEWESGEYAKTGTYSYESNIHTIDTTAPVYEVTYDNNTVIQTLNGREYYDDSRIATIKVTDRNFRPNEVVFNVSSADISGSNVAYTYSNLTSWNDWTKDGDTWTATVPFAPDANYSVDFAYIDIANHKMVNKNEAEEVYNKQFTVDTKPPVDLKVTYKSKDDQIINKILGAITFGNYKAGQEVVLSMTDATAGIDYIKLTVTPDGPASATTLEMPKNLEIYTDGSVKSGNKGFIGTIKSTAENGDLTLRFDVPAQFRGKVSFVAYDKSGNNSEAHVDPGVLVVDTIAPEHTISYNPSNVVNVSDLKDMDDFDAANSIADITSATASRVMYFSGDAVATIKIAEANFDPSTVTIEVLDSKGAAVQGWTQTDWSTVTEAGKADVHTKTITIAAEGDYQIKVYYQDHSMNTPVDYLSQWIVVDKTAPVIDVKYSNTDVKNAIAGRDYYSAVQTATITIKERNFRADDVVIKVTAKDVLGADVLTLDADGTVAKAYADQGADRKNWSAYETGTWRRVDDEYEITLNFTADANYTFDIAYQDLAKNQAADYAQDLFTVDATAPDNLTVTYSTSVFEQIKESITFGYYNAQMTVTITAEDDTSGIYHFAYSYINSEGVSSVNKQLLGQAIKEAEITYDGKKATATFTVPKMVLGNDNQFNGTVEFTAYDRSENSTELKDSTRIVVDNISPTATITYNNPVQENNGISFYDGNIEATIVINEANFFSNDVVVAVTRDGTNYPVNVAWRDNSVDSHTGTFTLTEDGDYVVSVRYRDKSGNQMADYTSNELTLDTTAPTIKVSDIKNNSANKDAEYGFVIEVNDINLDVSSIKPSLKAVKQTADGVYQIAQIDLGEATTIVDGQTYTYTVENLPDDGLYTLTCEVKDMSANGISQIVLKDGQAYDQVQFSINRSGSTFGFGNSFTEKLVDQYYIYSVDEDVAIVEVNVDPIEKYKVSLNGRELVEGTDYTTEQTTKDGEWSKRTYTIKKALFEMEGEYSIIVTSTDKADTTAFSDVKNLSLAFVVDQTKPILIITGLEAGGRYQTDAQTVTLIPTDEGGRLNSLSVVVLDSHGNPLKDKETGEDISVRFEMSGEELLKYLENNDGKVIFTIPDGLNNKVKIICNDCAVNAENLTNEYNELFENVTVSQNQFVIFYANKPLFYGAISGVVALGALIVILIKRKKFKKSKN